MPIDIALAAETCSQTVDTRLIASSPPTPALEKLSGLPLYEPSWSEILCFDVGFWTRDEASREEPQLIVQPRVSCPVFKDRFFIWSRRWLGSEVICRRPDQKDALLGFPPGNSPSRNALGFADVRRRGHRCGPTFQPPTVISDELSARWLNYLRES